MQKRDYPVEGPNGSICFWSWNGDMEEAEIKRQLAGFADGRFSGVILHARAGLTIPYMGEEWFTAFETAVNEAGRLGLEVWIYDEDGWPSGFAGGKVPAQGEAYWFKRLCFAWGRRALPSELEPHRIVAAYRQESECWRRIPPREAGEDALFAYYEVDRHYVDLLYAPVTEAFLRYTHEVYAQKMGRYFGTVIKGVFTDEPQLNGRGYPWSAGLEEAYRAAYGEDLLDSMWLAAVKGEGHSQFRYRLWNLISALYQRNFTCRLARWCEEHGLKLTGHFAAEDGLCDQLPCSGGVMVNYAHMQLPAIDHLGSRVASPILMKQAASVSRQLRDGNVLSETFGCTGWGVTFRQLAWIWGGQSVLGVTKPCYHLSAYSMEGRRKRDYPAFFSYQEPWWEEFSLLSQWIDGLNHLMTQGEREVCTLVISPLAGIMAEFEVLPKDKTEMYDHSAQYRLLAENLLDLQLDFELGDERLLAQHGRVENGLLYLGRGRYDTIFVPECRYLPEAVIRLLGAFAKSGGRLIFINRRPGCIDKELPDPWEDVPALDTRNRRDTIEKLLLAAGVPRQVTLCRSDDLRVAGGCRLHVRRLKEGRRLHVWTQADRGERELILAIRGACHVYRVDIATGTRHPLPSVQGLGDTTYTRVTVHAKENLVFETEGYASSRLPVRVLEPERSEYPALLGIALTADNCLTIDKAACSLNGGPYTEEKPVLRLVDDLYASTRTQPAELRLRYEFDCVSSLDRDGLVLAAEDAHCTGIWVNDQPVSGLRQGWWIDKSLGEYPIGPLTRVGKNTVILCYTLPPYRPGLKLDEIYETEKNRFTYPVEPESIYIRGAFDVLPLGGASDGIFRYSLPDAGFSLVPPTEKKLGDLTRQGLWFYRGDALYTLSVQKPAAGRRLLLRVGRYNGTFLECRIGDTVLRTFEEPGELDITDCLEPGNNTIILRLAGSNRNLLGPHHHRNGENFLVGPATFNGTYAALEEFMSPWIQEKSTWTDAYGVIPFGIEHISFHLIRETTAASPRSRE